MEQPIRLLFTSIATLLLMTSAPDETKWKYRIMIKCDKLVVKQLEDIISEKSNCHDVKHFMILA